MAHPNDDILERYALGRATEPEVCALEIHLLTCEACRVALTSHETAIEMIRLTWCESQFHMTEHGIVRVWVDKQDGSWVGHVDGVAFFVRRFPDTSVERIVAKLRVSEPPN
jgi:hypothetical protein